MKRLKRFFFIAIIGFSTSCAPIYIPNQVNAPLLKEKGDMNAAASMGTSGYDIQLAASPKNNLGIMLNASYYDSDTSHTHFLLEAATGYYLTLSDRSVFEIYAGGGYGYSDTESSGSLGVHKFGHYSKVFLQPSIGFSADYFEGAFSLRSAFIHFDKYGSGFFIEPVISTRFGFEQFKFTTQMGFSIDVTEDVNIDYQPFIFNIGIMYQIKGNAKSIL